MPTFNDFVQTELPKRPFTEGDGTPGQILRRSTNALAVREGEWVDEGTVLNLPAVALATPTSIAVKQAGVWIEVTWTEFLALIGSTGGVLGPRDVAINGVGVTINGTTVTITASGSEQLLINGVPLTINGELVGVTI